MNEPFRYPLYMVFDVESVGLHGEGFAVGWVVIDRAGNVCQATRYACDPIRVFGPESGRHWVAENCPKFTWTHSGFGAGAAVRGAFWNAWREWKAQGAALVADCPWPVEARFLARCVDEVRPMMRGSIAEGPRDWEGPYPLIDIASVRLAAGLDPLATVERLADELPIHDPLADARQSARLLIEALRAIEGI